MRAPKVLDTSALVAYLENEPGGVKVKDLLNEADQAHQPLYFSVVNWGELYYLNFRRGKGDADEVVRFIDGLPVELVDVNRDLGQVAAQIKAGGGISYADCFAAALAKLKNATLVTTDKEFRRLEGFIKILWV